jgi:putative FmdB family regulatory protein
MPIYAYKCESCGFAKDVLQKMSDPILEMCPQCAQATFRKQVTSAGFQLKGAGWYVTDFKGGNNVGAPAAPASETASSDTAATPAASTPTPAAKTESAAATAAAPAPAAAADS